LWAGGGRAAAGRRRDDRGVRARVVAPAAARPRDPDDAFEDRSVRVGTTFGGTGVIHGNLTPECKAVVRAVLEALGKKAGPGRDDRPECKLSHDALQLACALLPRVCLSQESHWNQSSYLRLLAGADGSSPIRVASRRYGWWRGVGHGWKSASFVGVTVIGSGETRLIILRGNSASGKSSTAAGIRRRRGRRDLAVVGQDNLRRDVLREHDVPAGVNIGLVDLVTRYALSHGFNVIVEGILRADHYSEMLTTLIGDHQGQACCYYLDVPFDETLLLLGSEASLQAVLVNRRSSEALSWTLAIATGVAQAFGGRRIRVALAGRPWPRLHRDAERSG
jgi:hypothetical protein